MPLLEKSTIYVKCVKCDTGNVISGWMSFCSCSVLKVSMWLVDEEWNSHGHRKHINIAMFTTDSLIAIFSGVI